MQANNLQKKKKAAGPIKGGGGGRGRGPSYKAPVAFAKDARFPASSLSRRNRSHRFQASELIGSVLGSIAFSATKYSVNPGLSGTFPRLSAEAVKWEQYKFHALNFRFLTRTGTSTVGSAIMSPEYSINDPAPTTEAQATNTQDAVELASWREEVSCKLDCQAMFPSGPRKLIRHGNVPGDLNLYDAANFFMCVVEQVGADAIGKLWVDYDVELFVPQNSSSTAPKSSLVSYANDTTAQTFTTTVATVAVLDAFTEDPLGIGAAAAGVYTPPEGSYEVTFNGTFADSSAESFTTKVEILKNGSSMTPPAISSDLHTSVAAGHTFVSVAGIVNCSGSDTVSIAVTLTGAAGTLTGVSNRCYLLIRAV